MDLLSKISDVRFPSTPGQERRLFSWQANFLEVAPDVELLHVEAYYRLKTARRPENPFADARCARIDLPPVQPIRWFHGPAIHVHFWKDTTTSGTWFDFSEPVVAGGEVCVTEVGSDDRDCRCGAISLRRYQPAQARDRGIRTSGSPIG